MFDVTCKCEKCGETTTHEARTEKAAKAWAKTAIEFNAFCECEGGSITVSCVENDKPAPKFEGCSVLAL